MAQSSEPTELKRALQIYPAKGLGWMNIGASLYTILTRLRQQPRVFPIIDLVHCSDRPILEPVIVNLPSNGIRLRFDGPCQELRLIELINFSQTIFTYKNVEIVRRSSTGVIESTGPSFRHVYNRLFGPAYAGDYLPPTGKGTQGTYILSYPGLAIRFNLEHSVWSDKADFVSLLSAAASPATSIAIFHGSSWSEAHGQLYIKELSFPLQTASASRTVNQTPVEVKNILLYGGGVLEIIFQTASKFRIALGHTTVQDLIVELGPPDAIYRKSNSRLAIHAVNQKSVAPIADSLRPTNRDTTPLSQPRNVDTDSDDEALAESESEEMFYNYFHHGFDILVSHTKPEAAAPPSERQCKRNSSHGLTAVKMFLHGNVPGSYSFNRHRRSRWTLRLPDTDVEFDSEMAFPQILPELNKCWGDHKISGAEQDSYQRGMVLNRSWGESSDSSIELLGAMDESMTETQPLAHGQLQRQSAVSSNTQLFGFPGMLLEVVKGGWISCVTIY